MIPAELREKLKYERMTYISGLWWQESSVQQKSLSNTNYNYSYDHMYFFFTSPDF